MFSLFRSLFTFVLLLVWSAALLACARAIPGWPVALLAGPLFTLPLASAGEWAVHAWLYHRGVPGFARIREIHIHGHHAALFPPTHYVQESGHPFMHIRSPLRPFRMSQTTFDSLFTSGSQVALHFFVGIIVILAPAWVFTGNAPFLVSCLGTLAVVSWLLAYVHGAIHTPRSRWIERQAWFQWLDHHHYIHHVDGSRNLNFMLPLFDFLLGTRKPELNSIELSKWPTFESAKPRAHEAGNRT